MTENERIDEDEINLLDYRRVVVNVLETDKLNISV